MNENDVNLNSQLKGALRKPDTPARNDKKRVSWGEKKIKEFEPKNSSSKESSEIESLRMNSERLKTRTRWYPEETFNLTPEAFDSKNNVMVNIDEEIEDISMGTEEK